MPAEKLRNFGWFFGSRFVVGCGAIIYYFELQ